MRFLLSAFRWRYFATAPFSLHILLSRQQYRQHSLLDVQSIFCLGEDLVGVGLEDSGRDLLAAVSGQAVEHHAVRLCGFQEAAGELEACKVPQAALALGGLRGRRDENPTSGEEIS